MENKTTVAVVIIGLLLIISMLHTCEQPKKVFVRPVKPDTTHVAVIKPVEVKEKAIPQETKVQKKANKPLRKKTESKTISLGTKVSKEKLTVQTIDTTGKIEEDNYVIAEFDEVSVDSEGNVEIKPDEEAEKKAKRKERRRKFLTKSLAVACLVVGILLGSKL